MVIWTKSVWGPSALLKSISFMGLTTGLVYLG